MKNQKFYFKFKILNFILSSTLLITLMSCEEKIKCSNCNGEGKVWSDYGYKNCGLCNGNGETTKSKEEKYFN